MTTADTAEGTLVRSATGSLDVVDLSHSFGGPQILDGINLQIRAGEFVSILGPSGSGKTTLLRIIGGLVDCSAGTILVDDRDITKVPSQHRNMGIVFQNYALFPHMTVSENVGFPLTVRRTPKTERTRQVREALELVHMAEFGDRYPGQLSGGQQQRVALARALSFRPRLLLMDEPLGSLDKHLREVLQIELRKIQQELAITTIYVTHDQEEAFTLSDRIAVMDAGHVAQFDDARIIYERPANEFVASFVGELNTFAGTVTANRNSEVEFIAESGQTFLASRGTRPIAVGDMVVCGIRPEYTQIISGKQDNGMRHNSVRGRVTLISFQGSTCRVEIDTKYRQLTLRYPANTLKLQEGDDVCVSWRAEHMRVLSTAAGAVPGMKSDEHL